MDRLLSDGHEVIGLDNLSTGRRENLDPALQNERFQWLQHDLTTPLPDTSAVDHVWHLASPASPPDYLARPVETLRVGSEGTRHALEHARAHGARFLLASTSEVYGDPEVHPQPETYWGHVNPVGPRSVYDEAKRYAEALTMAYHRALGLDTRIVRIFNTYGPRMRLGDGRVVPNFLSQALNGRPLTVYGAGSQTRSFCYYTDLLDGVVKAMRLPDATDPVNLGSDDEISILDFARAVQTVVGRSIDIVHEPLPEDDPKQRRPDLTRAKKLLDWAPRVGLEEGLRRTWQSLRAAPPPS